MIEFKRQKIARAKIPDTVRAKWPFPLLDEGFIPLPKKLLRVLPRLYPNVEAVQELCIIMAIVDFKRLGQTRNPSEEFLAFISGVDISEFRKGVNRLASKGWLVDVSEGSDEKNFLLPGLE